MEDLNVNTSESIRDAASKLDSREFQQRASEAMNQLSSTATDIYNKASVWMQGDQGKLAGVIAACAVCGLVGFALGRSMGISGRGISSSSLRSSEASSDAAQL